MGKISDTTGDDWSTMAKMYKALTVQVASKPINELLTRVNGLLPFSSSTGIHDNGCGPGPVMSHLIATYGPSIPASAPLSCSDFAPAMVEQVKAAQAEHVAADPSSPWTRVTSSVLNAMDLSPGVADGSRSHVTAGWVYFMTPDPQRCLSESRRVLREGGVLGCSSWEGSDWLEMMQLAREIRPEVEMPQVPVEWMSVEGVEGELEKAGFREVKATRVPVTMGFESYEALVELLVDKMPMMVKMLEVFSEAEKERLRARVREVAVEKAPVEPYVLHGAALVVVGRK